MAEEEICTITAITVHEVMSPQRLGREQRAGTHASGHWWKHCHQAKSRKTQAEETSMNIPKSYDTKIEFGGCNTPALPGSLPIGRAN